MLTSIIRVDDTGSGTPPSRDVDFFDSPKFTCATGDASDAYRSTGPVTPDSPKEPMSFTYNSKHRTPSTAGWDNLPWGLQPNWQTSQKLERPWQVVRPDAKAFRTAALVRAKTPYVLIADDIRMDQGVHNYKWRMMLPDDLKNRAKVDGNDVIYTAPDGKTGMLVRLLRISSPVKISTDNLFKFTGNPWLDISTDAQAADFRVLLMPFATGTPLPLTSWEGDMLKVDNGQGQVDHIRFVREKEGWTRMVYEDTGK
jgi:hypothetical protein